MQTPQLKKFLATTRASVEVCALYSAGLPRCFSACIGDINAFGDIVIRINWANDRNVNRASLQHVASYVCDICGDLLAKSAVKYLAQTRGD